MRGLREGLLTEAAVKQEVALAALLLPVSFFVASNVWVWLALVASVLFVLVVEFLNTAVERLCNHVTPERHEAIRVTKDLASTAVFFALGLAGLVWIVALARPVRHRRLIGREVCRPHCRALRQKLHAPA